LIAPVKAKGYGVHLDGARLANAAAAGFDLKAIAGLGVDILVVGGTKAGMPPTEAVVIFDRVLARRFDARLKQAGQLPSKGRFYAAPFIGMLAGHALVRHAEHANAMARKLAGLMPFRVTHPVEANAVFVEMDEARLAALHAAGWFVYRFLDGSVRFMCSWATTEAAVEELAASLRQVA
jgi:threonine aldolase